MDARERWLNFQDSEALCPSDPAHGHAGPPFQANECNACCADLLVAAEQEAASKARAEAFREAADMAKGHDCRGLGGACPDDCDVCLVAKQIADYCLTLAGEAEQPKGGTR